jgi:hypothetical protein
MVILDAVLESTFQVSQGQSLLKPMAAAEMHTLSLLNLGDESSSIPHIKFWGWSPVSLVTCRTLAGKEASHCWTPCHERWLMHTHVFAHKLALSSRKPKHGTYRIEAKLVSKGFDRETKLKILAFCFNISECSWLSCTCVWAMGYGFSRIIQKTAKVIENVCRT